ARLGSVGGTAGFAMRARWPGPPVAVGTPGATGRTCRAGRRAAWDNAGMGKSRNPGRRQAAAEAVTESVDGGLAQLLPDRERPRARTPLIDGAPQSHLDPDDPRHLSFAYQLRL